LTGGQESLENARGQFPGWKWLHSVLSITQRERRATSRAGGKLGFVATMSPLGDLRKR
jgi:hypothetical protein